MQNVIYLQSQIFYFYSFVRIMSTPPIHQCNQLATIKEVVAKLNDLDKEKALSNKTLEYMQKDITEIKDKLKMYNDTLTWFHDDTVSRIDAIIEKIDAKYATKVSVNKLRVIVWSIIGFVFTTLWTLVIANFILNIK